MIRIATVGYLNAAPLVAGLDHSVYQVNSDIPSRVAQALREGTADVALTPVVGALNDGDFRIVGGVAIGSEGPVHSVLLVAESEPEHQLCMRITMSHGLPMGSLSSRIVNTKIFKHVCP